EELEVKSRLADARPYGLWLAAHLRRGSPGTPVAPTEVPGDLSRRQAAFGYTREEITVSLRPMALTGCEPTSSMGDDTALPPLANRPRPVFASVKQRFAQVTNPPIDSLHERSVMSLATRLGPRAPLLDAQPDAA